MTRSQRRLVALIVSLPALVVAAALVYGIGMSHLEGTPRTLWESVGWAAETLTTTGYGADDRWQHPAMVLFVVLVQFVGVFLVFLIFPIYLIPFLEERFEQRLPRRVPRLRQHVIVFRYGAAVESLLEQLSGSGVPAMVVETDEGVARRLVERGLPVVYSHEDEDPLTAAGIEEARFLVANGRDEENAGITLGARQAGFTGQILALVEEPRHRKPMMLAGASAVYTPRHILAAALAARASDRISPRLAEVQHLGERIEVRELRIGAGSPLAGKTLEEAGIGRRTGVTVIGQWVGGRLEPQPTAHTRIEPRGILVVVGSPDNLQRFADLAEGATRLPREGPFLVLGFGEVGRKVHQLLSDVGEEVRVVDREVRADVDLVGDVLETDVVAEAGVEEARAVVLALDSDHATLFATVIVKDLAPEVPVIARVNQARNLERIHRAGADFALSISQVAGQILARRLLGQEAISVDPQLKVQRVGPQGLVGRHPAELEIRARTGCSVVAVERGTQVIVDLGPDFRFQEEDSVYICGNQEAIRSFLAAFPQGTASRAR